MRVRSKRLLVRRIFRYLRRILLLLVVLGVALLYYLNYVGIPAFLKNRLANELSRQGFDASFTDLRLTGWRTVVLEDFTLSRTNELGAPKLTGALAVAEIDALAIFGGRALQSLSLAQGRLEWPLFYGDAEPFIITNINVEFGSLPRGNWSIGILRARAQGVDVEISGAFKAADNRDARRRTPEEISAAWVRWQQQIGSILRPIQQMEMPEGGRIKVSFDGDLNELESVRTALLFETPRAHAPWGAWEDLSVRARVTADPTTSQLRGEAGLDAAFIRSGPSYARGVSVQSSSIYPLSSNAPLAATARITIAEGSSSWLRGTNLVAVLGSSHVFNSGALQHTLALTADSLSNKWVTLTDPRVSFQGSHRTPDAISHAHNLAEHTLRSFRALAQQPENWLSATNGADGSLELGASRAVTQWGSVSAFSATGRFAPSTNHIASRPELAWWNHLLPWQVNLALKSDALAVTNAALDQVELSAQWAPPLLTISNLTLRVADGALVTSLQADTLTRHARATAAVNIDIANFNSFLTPSARQLLEQITWGKPPHVEATASGRLPPWNTEEINWKELLPTVALHGAFEAGPVAYRGAEVDLITSRFGFTNLQWTLPDLTIRRPEGSMLIHFWNDMSTRDFVAQLDGAIDPAALKPALKPSARKVFDLLTFTEPPRVKGAVYGQWGRADLLGFNAHVIATNLTFRQQLARSINAQLSMTNMVLSVRDAEVLPEVGWIKAPFVDYYISSNRIFITNLTSHTAPMPVARALGRFAVRAIEPYTFKDPPKVQVHGWAPTDKKTDADLHFTIDGGAFNYWKFNVPNLNGSLRWHGDYLDVRDVRGGFYGGDLRWNGDFYFPDGRKGADFSFTASAKNAQLQPLLQDLLGRTNRMAGIFDALLVVTSADSRDMKSWDGYGSGQLTNGFLWDVPIFAFFTPVFEAIAPGLGRSEVESGDGSFLIRKSVLHTGDLEFHAPTLRLHYDGTVDFDGNVAARVEAELLRDTAFFGKLFSAALWPVRKILEYEVSGTLSEPKTKPVYLPEFLLAPFRAKKIISDMEANSILGRHRAREENKVPESRGDP